MDRALNRTSLKFGVPGLALVYAAFYTPILLGHKHIADMPSWLVALMWVGIIGGEALFVIGLAYYAAAKGHSRWAGLLGLLSLIGCVVIALLPDRHKQVTRPPE